MHVRRRELTPRSISRMQIVFLFASLLWGLDYLMPFHETILIDFLKVHAPLWFWGIILVNCSVTGLTSELFLRKRYIWGWGVSWGCHLILSVLYLSFAFGAFLQLIMFPVAGDTVKGLVDFIQTPLSCGLISYMHWQFSKRMDFVREQGESVDSGDWRTI